MYTESTSGLPDPVHDSQFYQSVPTKRFFAWLFDTCIILGLAFVMAILSIGTFFFIFAFVLLVTGFLYRWATLASGSATWGMRLLAVEIRNKDGNRLTAGEAFLHTLGYHLVWIIPFGIIISCIMMLVTDHKRGLHDLFLGTGGINRPADL